MGNSSFNVVRQFGDLQDEFWKALAALPQGTLDVRAALLPALARFGIVSDAAGVRAPLKDERPHWLIVYGLDQGSVVAVAAIPDAELSEDLRAKFQQEKGRQVAVVFGETCYDAPEQWEIWARFTLGVGLHAEDEFGPDLETRLQEGLEQPDAATLASWTGTWKPWLALAGDGNVNLERLDVGVIGTIFLREMM